MEPTPQFCHDFLLRSWKGTHHAPGRHSGHQYCVLLSAPPNVIMTLIFEKSLEVSPDNYHWKVGNIETGVPPTGMLKLDWLYTLESWLEQLYTMFIVVSGGVSMMLELHGMWKINWHWNECSGGRYMVSRAAAQFFINEYLGSCIRNPYTITTALTHIRLCITSQCMWLSHYL